MNEESTCPPPKRRRRSHSKRWRFNRWDALSVLGLFLLLGVSLLGLYAVQALAQYLHVGEHWFGKDSVVDGAIQTGIAGILLSAYKWIGPFGFVEPPQSQPREEEKQGW